MPKKSRKRKRKPTAKQLRALARGRAIRARKLRRKLPRKVPKKFIGKTLRDPTTGERYEIVPKKRRVMAKRRRVSGDRLTGGTQDVNPQLFSGMTKQIVINQAITPAFITPISRLPKSGGRTTVMELLKVWAYLPEEIIGNVDETIKTSIFNVCTKDYGTVCAGAEEPTVLLGVAKNSQGSFTATQTYGFHFKEPYEIDLTDGVGHGILVATDYLYMNCCTVGFTALGTFRFKILYRFKNVALTEYIGIVQSQQ